MVKKKMRRLKTDKLKLYYEKEIENLLIVECNRLFLLFKFNILLKKELINKKEYDYLVKKYI